MKQFNNLIYYIIIVINIFVILGATDTTDDIEITKSQPALYDETLFKEMYKHRRAKQLQAVKAFQRLKSYEKQYEMVEILSKDIFSMLEMGRTQLESSGYIPGVSSFPNDEETKIALALVLENTALFGEIVLRLPDIAVRIMRLHRDWTLIYQWCLTFLHEDHYLIDKATLKLMDLVQQELNYTTRKPDYHNPYRVISKNHVKYSSQVNNNSTAMKKERKKFHKGPILSRVEL